jgi:hypothetical protein
MRMKTSSAGRGQPPRDRSRAWSLLVTNLLVLPGLGSVMAGDRSGYLQIFSALAGFLLTFASLVRIVLFWANEFQLPDDPLLYRGAILGIIIFLAAWLWSLLLSLRFFREKK